MVVLVSLASLTTVFAALEATAFVRLHGAGTFDAVFWLALATAFMWLTVASQALASASLRLTRDALSNNERLLEIGNALVEENERLRDQLQVDAGGDEATRDRIAVLIQRWRGFDPASSLDVGEVLAELEEAVHG